MSSSELPCVGCRIRIISKAQIRYEGYLHSIDTETPNDPVITLSKVWSFGTENRPCSRYVGPRNELYEQIVFRGRDLEDVRVIHSSVFLNEDPSIVSAAPGTSLQDFNSNDEKQEAGKVSTSTFLSRKSNEAPQDAKSIWSVKNLQNINEQLSVCEECNSSLKSQVTKEPEENSCKSEKFRGRSDKARDEMSNRSISNYSRGSKNNFRSPNYASDGLINNYQAPFKRRAARYYGYSYRQMGGGTKPKEPFIRSDKTKFDEDYDIEKANAELALELQKIDISEKYGSRNGLNSESLLDGSGDNHSDEAKESTYDSKKSFFDTLSSEIMDRTQGLQPRRQPRDDRRLNYTTFGTSIPSPFRGGYGRQGYNSYNDSRRHNWRGEKHRFN